MHTQNRIPPRRTEAAVRRPRPAPLSPPPEWQAQRLFVEPHYLSLPDDDPDDAYDVAVPAPTQPPSFRPRRPYRP
ncbi:hypothetical protein ACFWP7_39700 [Streptomyces sp. NPDC058470]|uniref:hypothetical protein n=1 Tax=Streptomyces sp. NPDC058470 TaxID=3346515 RepID=UPI00365F4460